MDGIKNFLEYIVSNWATIVAIFGLAFAIYKKAEKTWLDWQAKSAAEKEAAIKAAQDEAIEQAKYALAEIILKLVSDAEVAWRDEGGSLGEIKRSEVISACFEKYPILLTVTDKQEVIDYIDNLISQALETVRKKVRKEVPEVVENNT